MIPLGSLKYRYLYSAVCIVLSQKEVYLVSRLRRHRCNSLCSQISIATLLYLWIYTEAFIAKVIYTLVTQTKELYIVGDNMTVMKRLKNVQEGDNLSYFSKYS